MNQLNQKFFGQPAHHLLEFVLKKNMLGRIALVSSFGTQSVVLLHLAAQVNPDAEILFIDTGKLFPETLSYQEELVRKLGLTNVKVMRPDPVELAQLDGKGQLWFHDNNACCSLRKIDPLKKELAHFDGWITGRKQYQGGKRKNLDLFERNGSHIKINPLAHWSPDQLANYTRKHDLPEHPLLLKNFKSVGCKPCTFPVSDNDDERAGRWSGQQKTECGIHLMGS